jgi:hypothetical protein
MTATMQAQLRRQVTKLSVSNCESNKRLLPPEKRLFNCGLQIEIGEKSMLSYSDLQLSTFTGH